MHHFNQATHHLLTGCEVSNNTIAQRTNGSDAVVRLFIHHFCLSPHGNHLVGATVKGNNGRFINHNLIITDNDCIGCTKVHRYFLNKRKKSHIVFIILQTNCVSPYHNGYLHRKHVLQTSYGLLFLSVHHCV